MLLIKEDFRISEFGKNDQPLEIEMTPYIAIGRNDNPIIEREYTNLLFSMNRKATIKIRIKLS